MKWAHLFMLLDRQGAHKLGASEQKLSCDLWFQKLIKATLNNSILISFYAKKNLKISLLQLNYCKMSQFPVTNGTQWLKRQYICTNIYVPIQPLTNFRNAWLLLIFIIAPMLLLAGLGNAALQLWLVERLRQEDHRFSMDHKVNLRSSWATQWE